MIAILIFNGNRLQCSAQFSIPLSTLISQLVSAGYKITEAYENHCIIRMEAADEPNNAYELFYLGESE